MKKIVKTSLVVIACTSCVWASGYRIPEQSFASTARAGASFANTNGAEASYYNPANMAFMDDKSHLEFALTYINLPSIDYTDAQNPAFNGSSTVEHFLAPAFHYVSPEVADNLRFGLSFTAPGGLSKRWKDVYPKAFAEEFSLKIMELNPSVSYKISDQFAIALGARMTYIDGTVKSDNGQGASRNLEGDSIDFGYNLAITYKPIPALTFATTYRSNIDLTVEGEATLAHGAYSGGAGVAIPLPAVFDLAVSYDFGNTIVEAVYERTFWSKYEYLDFHYDRDLTRGPLAGFDLPLPKKWKDVDSYRLGVTHKFNDKLSLLAGFAYDKTPTVDKYLGFELPDSDAMLYSLGMSYKISKDMTLGLAYLYDKKKERSINNRVGTPATNPRYFQSLNGKFENGSAHLVTASFMYEF